MHQISNRPNKNSQRAAILAPFFALDVPASRPRMAALALSQLMRVDVITSDYDHGQKKKRENRQSEAFEQIIYIKTMSYASNVGIRRLISHILFTLSAIGYLVRHRNRYHVVYATAPLNLLAWLAFLVSASSAKIIDVVDIWPDVLPFSYRQRQVLAPLLSVWKWLFKAAVRKANVVMAVSDEFACEAGRYTNKAANAKRFYIGHESLDSKVPKQSVFTIAYIGNIGHLYDFETLLNVLEEDDLRGIMQLFVIGRGDRMKWLLAELKRRKIQYRNFGVILEADLLADILSSCHAGFNGYNHTTASFSYKAATYLAAGLPIINSMTGDLEHLVTQFEIGENYQRGNSESLRRALFNVYSANTEIMNRRCKEFFCSELRADKQLNDMSGFLGTCLNINASH